jgi:hypothetical protein
MDCFASAYALMRFGGLAPSEAYEASAAGSLAMTVRGRTYSNTLAFIAASGTKHSSYLPNIR